MQFASAIKADDRLWISVEKVRKGLLKLAGPDFHRDAAITQNGRHFALERHSSERGARVL